MINRSDGAAQSAKTRYIAKCELAVETLLSRGEVRLRAVGTSMLPALWPGDEVRVQRVLPAEVAPGDIVMFYRQQRMYLHRVQEIRGPELSTQGDSLPYPDHPLPAAEVLGRVVSARRGEREITPRQGRVSSFLFRQPGWRGRVALRLHALRRRAHPTGALSTKWDASMGYPSPSR
jgi:hypothetical protein